MFTEEEIKKRLVEIIKNSYRVNFLREVTEKEIETVLIHLFPRMEKELKEIKQFSQFEFEKYMANKSNQLLFSPGNIIGEIRKAIEEHGVSKILRSGKYKRLREMEIAARFCIANYKITGDQLLIMPQDNPYVVLVLPDDSSTRDIKSFAMEVMTIPEIIKEKMDADLPLALTRFIEEKKFKKSYAEIVSLIVGFDFVQSALNFNEISRKLNEIQNNHYYTIYATFTSSEDGKTITVMQLYPGPALRQDYDLERERNLFY